MTAAIPVFKPVSQMQLAPGSTVTIPDVSWEEFESILQELGEKRTTRIAYSQGTLEIMAPLPEHEIPKDLISDIVKILLKAKDIKYQPFGSTTFKRQGVAGVESDACFYIQNYRLSISAARLIRIYPEYAEALKKLTQAMQIINDAVELIESAEDNLNIRNEEKFKNTDK